jgi:hypothetical protein
MAELKAQGSGALPGPLLPLLVLVLPVLLYCFHKRSLYPLRQVQPLPCLPLLLVLPLLLLLLVV